MIYEIQEKIEELEIEKNILLGKLETAIMNGKSEKVYNYALRLKCVRFALLHIYQIKREEE